MRGSVGGAVKITKWKCFNIHSFTQIHPSSLNSYKVLNVWTNKRYDEENSMIDTHAASAHSPNRTLLQMSATKSSHKNTSATSWYRMLLCVRAQPTCPCFLLSFCWCLSVFFFFFFFFLLTWSAVVKCDGLAFGAFPGCVTRCFTLTSRLHHAMSPFCLFLSYFSGMQRILGYVRPRRIIAVM